MNNVKFVLFSAGILLALVFVFSCSSNDDGGGNSSLSYQGKTYKTVKIGKQTWMAENLNYNASGSRCYDDLEANCAIYGRLYSWATAMGIDAKYNKEKWNGSDVKHQGICPGGWHIPSNDEWDELLIYVDNDTGGDGHNDDDDGTYYSTTAGKYLKSKSGWNDYYKSNGEDKFGFSALPGGDGLSDGFYNVGDGGYWWSSTESYGGGFAWRRRIYIDEKVSSRSDNYKGNLFSVRCVQD